MIGREQGLVVPGTGEATTRLEVAHGIIKDATHDQLGLIASGRFDALQGRSGDDLLSQFSRDQAYMDLIRAAKEEATSFEDDHLFERHLAGALFEELALAHLGSRQDLGGVVISGVDLFDAMTVLHPGRTIIDDGFGQKGILGRFIPDGLLVGETDGRISIQGVIEITLGKWSEKIRRDKQIRGYQFLLRDLEIADSNQAPLIIVTPQFDDLDNGYNGYRHLTVPVRKKRDFIDGIFDFAYFRDTRMDGVTLNQVRQDFRRGDGVIANPASV